MDWFSLIPVCRCPWIRLQLPLTAPTEPVWSVASVRLLPRPQNRKQGRTRAFPFSAHSLPRVPVHLPRGECCYGAEALDVSKLQGKRLINLDGCEGTNTYVSSFRSDLVKCEKTLRWESASGAAVQVEVRDVSTNVYQGVPHQEQGNAVKLLARLLRAVSEAGATLRLFALEGGMAENIVPETAAVRFCYEGCSPEKLRALLQETFSQLTQELEKPAQAGTLRITEVPAPDRAVTAQDSTSLAGLLYLLPNNLFQAAAGEMTSICNLGVVKLDGERAWALLSTRSRYASAGEELLRRCHTLADLTGFSFSTARRYEGWPYREDSPLRALATFNPVRHTPHLLKNGRKKSPDHLRA